MSRVVTIVSGLIAAAIWVPWPFYGVGDAAVRDARFVSAGDSAVQVSNLSTRPLLDPTRGATARATAAKPQTPTMEFADRFVLRGLAKHEAVSIAVIEDRAAKKFVRLQRGQTVGDWFLADVSGVEAKLQNASGETRSLKLPVAGAGGIGLGGSGADLPPGLQLPPGMTLPPGVTLPPGFPPLPPR